MGDYIKDALLGASPHGKLKEESKVLVEKWDKTGLLDGIDGDYNRGGMSILLENQARELIDESTRTGVTGNSEQWSGVALPLVRRIFGEISAQEFVSVQPMNLPSGLVFYLDFKYGSNWAGRNYAGDGTESMLGTVGKYSPMGDADEPGNTGTFPRDGLYGAGQFAYTMPTSSADVSAAGATSTGSATLADLNYDTDLSASNAGNLYKVVVTGSLTRPDNNSVRGWTLDTGLDSGSAVGVVYPEFTKSGSDGITFIVSGSDSTYWASQKHTITYFSQPTDQYRGDFEDGAYNSGITEPATNLPIPEVNLELKSSTIVAKTRKLKAVWTPELAQDLNAYHSVDAEAELTSMLSEYISMEIDLEILDMLILNAPTVERWSAKIGDEWNGSSFDAVTSGTANGNYGYAYTKSQWYETLGQKIQKLSNKIHQLTLRGGANFVVCSPAVATIIESIPGFGASTDGNKSNFAMGVKQIGSLSNRWNVYKNPYMTENQILVGFRGSNFLETGAVYAPYVPLIMTPLIYDPTNFTPRKGVMTRYAKKMVRPEFYGLIQVAGLETV